MTSQKSKHPDDMTDADWAEARDSLCCLACSDTGLRYEPFALELGTSMYVACECGQKPKDES